MISNQWCIACCRHTTWYNEYNMRNMRIVWLHASIHYKVRSVVPPMIQLSFIEATAGKTEKSQWNLSTLVNLLSSIQPLKCALSPLWPLRMKESCWIGVIWRPSLESALPNALSCVYTLHFHPESFGRVPDDIIWVIPQVVENSVARVLTRQKRCYHWLGKHIPYFNNTEAWCNWALCDSR